MVGQHPSNGGSDVLRTIRLLCRLRGGVIALEWREVLYEPTILQCLRKDSGEVAQDKVNILSW